MKTKYIIATLCFTFIAQLFVPLKIVYDCEMTEKYGRVYKFKTEPVDPNDIMRGKYVALNFEADTIAMFRGGWLNGEKAYAVIENDAEGFAWVKLLQKEKPGNDVDYIPVEISFNNGNTQYFNLPFDRFYMEEHKAPLAEIAYREYNRQEHALPAYALVAVKDGNTVLKDVIIDGLPIKDYIAR